MMLVKMIADYSIFELESRVNQWFGGHSGITIYGVNYETTAQTNGDILFSCMIVYRWE